MLFLIAYFSVAFLALGIGAFYILKEMKLDPLVTVNKFLIYYFLLDLIIRLLLQAIPVMNIRPLLILPIKKPTIVHFSLGKTILSFFNFVHAFFFIPFTIVLIIEGYDVVSSVLWYLAMISLIYINNFLNILLNNKDNLFAIFVGIVLVLGGCQYYKFFDITNYTSLFFDALFHTKWMFLFPVMALVGLYYFTFHFFKNNLYLDAGLSTKNKIAKTEDLTWLNQFGTLGTFLKNDIKLIKRNKRSKTTVIMSVVFLFYGLLFFKTNGLYNPVMHIFAGIFVSGGFLFTFGQFVPSWDSAYYPLMMTQNIPYKGYLSSKWWLIVIATFISTILASFYLYFGWQVYLTIVVGAIYNIGVNSHLVLLAGAYTKTPIDLDSTKGAFGDKKAFNVNTMLISLPKLLLPLGLYWIGSKIMDPNLGLALVAIAGLIGFALKDKVFSLIEKIYKTEKYKTIDAYKQKS
ncbi:multisubunit Na+/H+ antiporter MnhC subunit [Flavobacterium sp. CG_9.10]|nr:multisubunit Na+/H+ antiporter MnhC subunit [Flavobacterium sp. CG_9.10]